MTGKRGVKVSDAEFAELFEASGPHEVSQQLGISVRNVHYRRKRVEKALNRPLQSPILAGSVPYQRREVPERAEIRIDLQDGIVLVASDAHYWPGMISTAHAGFVRFVEDLKPSVIVQNGDVVDGATLSRHASIGWEYKPAFHEELEACQHRLAEIECASDPETRLIWPAGNHDLRFESKIANTLPELANIKGVHLKDHFPSWEPCWRVRINDTMLKHRFKSGLHAAFNNAIWSGMSIVTGHLHKGIVYPFTDYNGTRYGVDAPTLAEPADRQFTDYTEAGPTNWRSGFVVLTYIDGVMCQPELAFVHDVGVIEFRGKRIKV